MNNSKPIIDDKININNTLLNASLINLSSLIQKILDESKRSQENDSNEIYSTNSIILNENVNTTKNKNIEVKKKSINNMEHLDKTNGTNQILGASPNKQINDRNIYSNLRINTLSNINNNYQNYMDNAIEKSHWSVTQEDKHNRSNDVCEYIEEKNKIKPKIKKYNLNNKSLNSFDYRKSVYNMTGNKTGTTKSILNKKLKNELSLKKLKSNKIIGNKNRNNSKKNMSEESKIKDENKEIFINKNNKIYKLSNNGNNTSSKKNFQNNIVEKNKMRKSYQNLINSNYNNVIERNRNRSKSNHKISITQNITKTNLRNKTKNDTNKDDKEIMKNLSLKEKSYYILSKSPILRLKERLIFGRSTPNLRKFQAISEIVKNNKIFLENKIQELEEKMAECDKRITSKFSASKTAEINFNFILTKDEEEFKNYIWFTNNEKEKIEYFHYLKILYLLFNENYDNIELKNLSEKLYTIIKKKGFKTIKDILYDMYFKKKENNNIVLNIDKINEILEEADLKEKFNIKFCRFGLFTSFLVKEIIKYGNDVKNMVELKLKTKEFIDVINKKLELYKIDDKKL